MIGGWSAANFGLFFQNQPLEGAFTPVAAIEASTWGHSQVASGLLVHPRLVLTVAHAVLFRAGVHLFAATQVKVELGNVRAWADAVVIPSRFIENAGFLATADLAVLRMPMDVSGPLDSPPLLADSARDGEAMLWGWTLVRPRTQMSIPITVTASEDGHLRYPAANLPAFSGGPLLRSTGPGQPDELMGLHRAFHADTQQGEAIPFSSDDVLEAMHALGFDV